MDALTYLKEKTRMCDETEACYKCILFCHTEDGDYNCEYTETEYPDVAVELIDQWSRTHPEKEKIWKRVKE